MVMSLEKNAVEKYKKAGKIASEARTFAESLVKDSALLIEIAQKVEDKIKSLGGDLAFPVNLSLNEDAAHFVPDVGDNTALKQGDLVKIDLGVSVDGYIADTAITILIGDSEEKNKTVNVRTRDNQKKEKKYERE